MARFGRTPSEQGWSILPVVVMLLVFCMTQSWADNARAAPLLVGGTGTASPLLKLLFTEFARQEPGIETSVVDPALGSRGGINALIAGRIDMAIISSQLKPADLDKLGRHFSLCKSPFVLVTNGGQRKNGFTLDELARAYQGQLTHWDNGMPIRLVLRDINDSDSVQLKTMSSAMEQAVIAASHRAGMVQANDDLETLAIESRTPGSLGPGALGLIHTTGAPLKPLSINGIAPTLENLKNGSYPWHKTLSVVLPAKPSPAAEKFYAFLQSESAKTVLLRHQFQALTP